MIGSRSSEIRCALRSTAPAFAQGDRVIIRFAITVDRSVLLPVRRWVIVSTSRGASPDFNDQYPVSRSHRYLTEIIGGWPAMRPRRIQALDLPLWAIGESFPGFPALWSTVDIVCTVFASRRYSGRRNPSGEVGVDRVRGPSAAGCEPGVGRGTRWSAGDVPADDRVSARRGRGAARPASPGWCGRGRPQGRPAEVDSAVGVHPADRPGQRAVVPPGQAVAGSAVYGMSASSSPAAMGSASTGAAEPSSVSAAAR